MGLGAAHRASAPRLEHTLCASAMMITSCRWKGLPRAPFSPYRVVARAKSGRVEFGCSHDGVLFDTSESTKQALADFQELKPDPAEVPMTGAGWLRLVRDSHGAIAVRYKIGHRRLAAVLEGAVAINAEFG